MTTIDGIIPFTSMIFFYILLLLIHLFEESIGLSIELIHPFSPDSPFYDPNITYSEMIERFDSGPMPRGIKPSNNTFLGTKAVRPMLENNKWGFHAKLNLGTFHGEDPPYKTSYLHFDTTSDLIWLECEDCAKPYGICFREHDQAYPNRKSRTYAPLIYNHHPLCIPDKQMGRYCAYSWDYGDTSSTKGILAHETFTLDSSHSHPAEALRIVIGCGIINKMTNMLIPSEVGVMGMGWGSHSLVNQLNTHSMGRFSYCLPPLASDVVGGRQAILRFGLDSPTIHDLHSLTIYRYWRKSSYYVKLQDISIDNRRLHIPPEYFAKTSPDKGGCIFNTGVAYSYIPREAYRILKEQMIHHLFTIDRNLRIAGRKGNLDLCVERNPPRKGKGYAHFPSITFHFEEGTNFVIQHNIAFVTWLETHIETFCMTIKPAHEDNIAVIGAQAQANHVIVYDLPSKKMFFGPRDCTQNT